MLLLQVIYLVEPSGHLFNGHCQNNFQRHVQKLQDTPAPHPLHCRLISLTNWTFKLFSHVEFSLRICKR